MQDEMTSIADKVRGIAAEKRADQDAVAKVLGLSRQAVNQRFNGRVPFAGAELLRLARVFNTPITRFFPDEALEFVKAAASPAA